MMRQNASDETRTTPGQDKKRRVRVPTCCLVLFLLVAIIAAGVVFFRVGGKLRVQAAIDDIRARGEPTCVADIIPPDVPDAENAFIAYQRAGTMLSYGRQRSPAKDPFYGAVTRLRQTPPAQWQSGDIQLVRSHVQSNAAAVRLAHEGARRSGYKSNIRWEDTLAVTFPELSKARNITRELDYQALADIADGDPIGAIETCGDALRLADDIGSEPALLCHLVEIGCRGITLETLEHIAEQSDRADELELLLQILTDTAPQPRMEFIMASERALMISGFEDARTGRLPVSWHQLAGPPNVLSRIPLPGWLLYPDELVYLDLMGQSVDLGDRPAHEISADLSRIEQQCQRLPAYARITARIVGSYADFYRMDASVRMRTDVLRTAAAAKLYKLRHGTYPRALSDLVPALLPEVPIDAFSGRKLRYTRTAKGFYVYSVGRNGKDDGGMASQIPYTGDIVYEE